MILLLPLQPPIEYPGLGSVPLFSTQIVAKQVPAVFILVAVHAQVFPVRAVRGIVPVVPVFMMHSQQVSIFIVELSTTFGAYKPVNTQRAFSIVAGRRNVLPQFPDDLINGLVSLVFLGRLDLRLPPYVLPIVLTLYLRFGFYEKGLRCFFSFVW